MRGFNIRHIAASCAFVFFVSASPLGLPPAQAQTATAQPLNDASLQEMLVNMGYETKPLEHGYLITISQDGWTTYIQLLLSADGSKLGMNANLGTVDPNAVTASQWLALLTANSDIDPSFFYYDKDKNELLIHRVLDNTLITPQLLRTQIDNFADNIKSTEQIWSFTH